MDTRWTLGGRGPHSNNVLDFIIECSVARQDPRHSLDREYSTWLVRNSLSGLLCAYLWSGTAPPPHIHLTSTSHDKCFQAFPVFRRSSASVWMQTKKTGETCEQGASVYTRWWKAYSPSALNIIAPFVSLAELNQTVILCSTKVGIGVTMM